MVSWRLGTFCSGPMDPRPDWPHKGLPCGGHPCGATSTLTDVPFSIHFHLQAARCLDVGMRKMQMVGRDDGSNIRLAWLAGMTWSFCLVFPGTARLIPVRTRLSSLTTFSIGHRQLGLDSRGRVALCSVSRAWCSESLRV